MEVPPNGQLGTDEEWVEDLPPVAGALGGKSRADLEMHAEARAELLNLLLLDPDVTALFDRWTLSTPTGRLACRLGKHLERTAWTAGFATTSELLRAIEGACGPTMTLQLEVADEAEADRVRQTINDLVREADQLGKTFLSAVRGFDPSAQTDEAIRLVRDRWRLPWPWLAWELIRCWTQWLGAAPFGRICTVNFWVEPNEMDRPAPSITFTTGPDESIADAMRRAMAEVFTPLESTATAAKLPPGRRTDPGVVARYVGWWYRRRIRGESVRSIAGKHDDRRKLVRHGVAQAERWLGLVNWRWTDDAA